MDTDYDNRLLSKNLIAGSLNSISNDFVVRYKLSLINNLRQSFSLINKIFKARII